MKNQLSKPLLGPLRRAAWLALMAGALLVGLLWLTSGTAAAQEGITIEAVGTTDLYMDSNGWCSSGNVQGPDGSWYPVRITNNSANTYTGLRLQIVGPNGVVIDDGVRYIGDLGPGEWVKQFIFVDYVQLRDWLPCGVGDPPVTYNELFTVTLDSLSGGLTSTVTYTDAYVANGMTSANAGGAYLNHRLGPGNFVGQILSMTVNYDFGNNPADSPLFMQPTGNGDFLDPCFRLVGSEVISSEVTGVSPGVTDTLWFSSTDTAQGDRVGMRYYFEILCSQGATASYPWTEITSGIDEKYNSSGYGGDAIITITNPISNIIGVSKWVTLTVLPNGGTVTYTIRFQNYVTVPILVSVITDILPSGVTFGGVTPDSDIGPANSSIYPNPGDTGTLLWYGIPETSYSVPPSGTVPGVPGYIDLIYTATVTSTKGFYTNWVVGQVGKEQTEPVSSTVWVGEFADLAVSKSSEPVPAIPGGPITYTIVVTNFGPSMVTAITLTDNLPSAILNPIYTPSTGTYDSGTGAWTGLMMHAGDEAVLTIAGTVDPGFGGVLVNTVVVTPGAGVIDPHPGDNEDTDHNSAGDVADLELSKSSQPVPAVPGETITYTLVVTNLGPSVVTYFTLTDNLPAAILNPVYTPSAGTYDPVTGLWTDLTMNAGDQVVLTIVGTLDPAFVGTLMNTAVITPGEAIDPDPGDNQDQDDNPTAPSADLWLTKVGEPDPVAAGENLTYTLTVHNDGPSDAQGVVVTDTLPALVAFVDATQPYLYLPPDVVWDLGTLPAGETRVLTVVVTVDPGAGLSGTITNTAVLVSDTPDPDPGDERADEPVDLIVCSVGPDDYEPDQVYPWAYEIPTNGTVYTRTFHMVADKDWLTFEARAGLMYTLTTFNLGDDVDTVLQLYDVDGSTLLLENDDYMPGSRASRIVWVAPADGFYFIRTTHFDHTYNPRLSDICGNHYNINVNQQGLSLVKTAEDLNGPPLYEGDEIQYTLVVRNELDEPQTGVVIVDPIPAYTTYVSGSAQVSQGTVSGPDPLVAHIGTLQPRQVATFTFRVTVDVGAADQVIQNYAQADSDQQDPPIEVGPIEPPGGGRVMPPEDALRLLKTAEDLNGEPLYPGDVIRYDLFVTNLLDRPQTGVVITDAVPAYTTYVSGSAAVSQGSVSGPDPLVAAIGTLAPGQTATFTFQVRVDDDAVGQTIENYAQADSEDNEDPVPVGPITPPGGGEVVPFPQSDLAVTKSYTRALTTITYTLVARNLGPEDGSGAVLYDAIAPHIEDVTWTCAASGGAVCPASGSGNIIDEVLTSFPAGGVAIFTVAGRLDIFADESNIVTITAPWWLTDTDESNNTAVVGQPYKLLIPLSYRLGVLGSTP